MPNNFATSAARIKPDTCQNFFYIRQRFSGYPFIERGELFQIPFFLRPMFFPSLCGVLAFIGLVKINSYNNIQNLLPSVDLLIFSLYSLIFLLTILLISEYMLFLLVNWH